MQKTVMETITDRLLLTLANIPGVGQNLKSLSFTIGMTHDAYLSRKSRNSVPYDLIMQYCIDNNISANWVIAGQDDIIDIEEKINREIPKNHSTIGVKLAMERIGLVIRPSYTDTLKPLRDADIASALKMTAERLYQAKKRDSIPYKEIVHFCLNNHISLNWIFANTLPKEAEVYA